MPNNRWRARKRAKRKMVRQWVKQMDEYYRNTPLPIIAAPMLSGATPPLWIARVGGNEPLAFIGID